MSTCPQPHATPRLFIGLHRGRGFVSSLIRWQTRSRWNHVSLWIHDGGNLETCYEAREFRGGWWGALTGTERGVVKTPGVDRRRQALDSGEEITFFELDFNLARARPNLVANVANWCEFKLGERYDYLSVLRFVSRRKPRQNDSWFCSEFAFAALQSTGIRLLERIEAAQVSPAHVALSPLLTHVSRRDLKP